LKGTWAVPVIVSILVIGLLYSVDTQTVDAHISFSCLPIGTCSSDGNVCTRNSCVSSNFGLDNHCIAIPLTGNACSDGNVCTTGDICEAGACVSSPIVCEDDGNECTVNSCVSGSGCVTVPVADGTTCGNPGDSLCDLQDTCDGAGACNDVVKPEETVCGDPVPDVNQSCNAVGICVPSSALVCEELVTCGLGTVLDTRTNQCIIADDDDDDDEDDDDEDNDDE